MSAQGYTNRVRVLTEARNSKVQQFKNISNSYVPIQPCACVSPNYAYINYILPTYCGGLIKPPCLKQ